MAEEQLDIYDLPKTIGKFVLSEVIGMGAFSVVYKAQDTSNGEIVAMKVVPKRLIASDKDREHLQRELDTITCLRHPNIVSMREFFYGEDCFYLILDYCAGGSLNDILAQNPTLREATICSIFRSLISAVQFCHQCGVVHRDLKPQNILVTTFPEVKLSDFGLCGYIVDDKKFDTFCGSPCYVAPECLAHQKYDGAMADMWGCGVILYEIATGTHPWPVRNMAKMIQQISAGRFTIPRTMPPALADLIKGLLKVNAKERMNCDRALAHPWMRISAARNRAASLLPSLNKAPVTMACLTSNLHRTLKDGIANPLESIMDRLGSTGPRPLSGNARSGTVSGPRKSVNPKMDSSQSCGRYASGTVGAQQGRPVPRKRV